MSVTNNKRRREPSSDADPSGEWSPRPEPAGVISWHDHFMNVAKEAARLSRDPACRVGAALVAPAPDNRLLAEGHNSMPHDRDDQFPWDEKKEKLRFVCHAEMNCVLSAARQGALPAGCRLYVTRVPCGDCAKLLVQGGVRHVVYCQRKYAEVAEAMYSRLREDGFKLEQYKPDNPRHARAD